MTVDRLVRGEDAPILRRVPDAPTFESILVNLPNRYFDPKVGADLYRRYFDEAMFVDEVDLPDGQRARGSHARYQPLFVCEVYPRFKELNAVEFVPSKHGADP